MNHVIGGMKQQPSKSKPASKSNNDPKNDDDIQLFQKARALSVQHPMYWSRESKRKIRKGLANYKAVAENIMQSTIQEKDDNATSNHADGAPSTTTSAATNARMTSEEYRQTIRTPTIKRVYSNLSQEEQYADAQQIQSLLKNQLAPQNYNKMIQYIQDYVNTFENLKDNKIDDDDDDDDISTATTTAKQQHQSLHQQQIRMLKSNLQKCVPTKRTHWIAVPLAEYFFITTQDEITTKTIMTTTATTTTDTKNDDTIHDTSFIENDTLVQSSQQNWDQIQEKYVQSFLKVQKLLSEEEEKEQRQREKETAAAGIHLDDDAEFENNNNDDDDDDEDFNPLSTESSIMETFAAVSKSSSDNPIPTSTTARVHPRKYITLEAMDIESTTATDQRQRFHLQYQQEAQQVNAKIFSDKAFPMEAPTDRLVVIDNLPVDIDQHRLWTAFGRCGEIEAIEIFHHRPELDPGRKSIDDRKKIRNPSSTSRRHRWQRPRTPLYGMILFKDAAGAARATADPLRIFGMVLDKHLIRSHPAYGMTKLYLEDVSNDHGGIPAIEYNLSRLLHPDLYVCLDGSGQDRRLMQRHKKEPLSCIIKFPSFEAAYWAYQKLCVESEFLKEGDGCELHWMETPVDAMLYWTRQLNF
jgi:hypothetical protein